MNIAVMLLAVVFSASSIQAFQNADPGLIADVQVRGNRRVPSDTIKYNILTKPGDVLLLSTIQRDIRTLYALGYFDDIRVEEEQADSGKIIVFIVTEKPLIRSIEYEGANSITRSEILEKFRENRVGISQESPFDPARVKRAEAVIKAMLAEKGRQNATVETVTESIPPNAIGLTFKIDEGPKIKIDQIDIEGNEIFSDRMVKDAMNLIKEAGPLTVFTGKDTYHDLKLADDITRIRMLYAEHGYIRANILEPKIEIRPRTVHRTLPFIKPTFPWGIPLPFWKKEVERYYITINIEENNPYRVGEIRVAGSKEFTSEQIRLVLGLVPDQIYNETLLRQSFENLTKLYGSRGYINFTPVPVKDLDEENRVVNLTINIDEDRQFIVNQIAFSGNSTTRDKVIRREIMIDEGQIFNSALWDLSLLRLNQLGYFEEVKKEDAEIRPNPSTDQVDINLRVREKGRNSIGFNGGVSGVGGSFLGLDYSTNNFLGLGETMSIGLQGGTRQSQYQFSFTEPYFLNRPLTTAFSLFSSSSRYDQAREVFGLDPGNLPAGVGFEDRLNFEQERSGFSTTASYSVKLFHRLGLSYQFDNSATSAINPATEEYFRSVTTQEQQSFVPGNSGSLDKYYARRLTTSYTFNTINNPFSPTTGRSFTSSLEFTGGFLGGNVNFYRPTFEFRAFKPVNRGRNTLAVRAMVSHVRGFTNSSVPFYERFFLGGDFDIRGFDFRSVSPIAYITRTFDDVDFVTGVQRKVPYDDIVYVGGDTQGVFNFEYRIPLAGPITLSPFVDVGNSWVFQKKALQRQIVDSKGVVRLEQVRFLPGTNSGLRISTGVELQVVMPVINQPFRLILAFNPSRIDRTFTGPVTGLPFSIREPGRDFKFTVGKTF